MAEKKYYWLKMTDQFFEDKAIKKLRKIAGGDTYTIIYLKMLLTAIKQGNKMYFEGIEDDFMEELALELDEDTDNVKVSHGRKKRYSLYRNRSHPYAPGESKKGSRRFDGAGRIDEKTGVFTEFNGCSGRRTAWRVLCVDRKPPAWSIKVGRPGRIAMQDRRRVKPKRTVVNHAGRKYAA